jgi:hypothetical protein
MWGLEAGEESSAVNVALLMAWAVLPGLVLAYVRSVRAVRRSRSEFTLCKSEAAELSRATRLFDQIRRRLAQLERPCPRRRLWPVLLKAESDSAADLEERHDLEAYAEHLQATILQLKRRPLQRLRAWIHTISSHDALAGATAVYFIGLAFALTASNFFEGGGVFLANGAVTAVAAIAALLIYPAQRARLRRQHGLEFQLFRDLAQSDVEPEIEPAALDQPAADAGSSESDGSGHWCAVLGLPPAAAIDDIRQAYKTLIKQNHPDRVHGMSPAFKALAEAETKRINAAYRQALAGAPQLEPEYHAA